MKIRFSAYKCCYCGAFNPARQQRLNAPKLERQTPVARQSSTSSKEGGDEGARSEEESKINSSDEEQSSKENIGAGIFR